MKFIPTTESDPIRFGIVISTKVTKKAVLRNKIKRQIRDVLKKKLPNWNGKRNTNDYNYSNQIDLRC